MTAVDRNLPGATDPGTPREGYLIVQAALFYLEASVLALGVTVVACSLSFVNLAQFVQTLGWTERGTSDVTLFVLLAAEAIVTAVLVFLVYFWLLATPIIGQLVCAIGSLLWAFAFGFAAGRLGHLAAPGWGIPVGASVGVAVAATVFWHKCRVVSPYRLGFAVRSRIARSVSRVVAFGAVAGSAAYRLVGRIGARRLLAPADPLPEALPPSGGTP